jgi:hypothetical protein
MRRHGRHSLQRVASQKLIQCFFFFELARFDRKRLSVGHLPESISQDSRVGLIKKLARGAQRMLVSATHHVRRRGNAFPIQCRFRAIGMLPVKKFLLIARNNLHLTSLIKSFVRHKKRHILAGEWATWAWNNPDLASQGS